MNRIDRFAEALLRKVGGERLVLAAGAKAFLQVGGKQRAITNAAIGAKLLEELVGEIAPPDFAEEIAQDGERGFEYTSPHGTVLVSLRRLGDSILVELLPSTGTSEPDPVPAPEAPATRAESPAEPAAAQEPVARVATGSTASIDELFRTMVDEGCSDLHLSSGSPPLFRKDGGLVDLTGSGPFDADRIRALLASITPKERWTEFGSARDSDFAYEIVEVGRFRCNLFVDRNGMGGVFRLIPTEILTAEDLGLSSQILKLCKLSKGLVVVTGPTGSGKSTTLAAMVDWINRNRTDHIITIEDPIEFVHPNKQCLINQREIGAHTDGFKSALRAALREDPDIVLVGEMRDLETVEIAIETAETGHLVFGTLHTNTAPSTVDRIIDQFPTDRQSQIRAMLSESLKGVIAQTLCKKRGGGRVAALEVLIANHAISNLIREGKTFQIPSIMQTGRKLGMATLNDALLELVVQELVEPEEAWFRAVQKAELAEQMRVKGFALPEDDEEPG